MTTRKHAITVPDDLWPELPDTPALTQIVDAGIRSRSQLGRDIAAGRLPAFKLGNRLFIRKADLLAMVKPVRGAS